MYLPFSLCWHTAYDKLIFVPTIPSIRTLVGSAAAVPLDWA